MDIAYFSKTVPHRGTIIFGYMVHIQVCEDVQVFEEISGKNLQVVVGYRPDTENEERRTFKSERHHMTYLS